jgi:hypothetical protein
MGVVPAALKLEPRVFKPRPYVGCNAMAEPEAPQPADRRTGGLPHGISAKRLSPVAVAFFSLVSVVEVSLLTSAATFYKWVVLRPGRLGALRARH